MKHHPAPGTRSGGRREFGVLKREQVLKQVGVGGRGTQSDLSHPHHSHQPGPSHLCLPPSPPGSTLAGLLVSVSCVLWSIFHTGSLSDPFKMQIGSCYSNMQNPPRASHHLEQYSEFLPWLASCPGSGSNCLPNLSSPCFPLCSLTGLLALP